jgi:hypothetical protein
MTQPTGPASVSATISSGTPMSKPMAAASAVTKLTERGYARSPTTGAMGTRSPIPLERIAVAAGLGVLFLGLWLAISRGLDEDAAGPPRAPVAAPQPRTPARPKPAAPRPAPFVRLTAAGALDPEGDGRERDEEAGLAVDGRRDTAWRTERYSSFFKDGVGLVLDAGRRVRVERVVVDVPARGASAAIRLGDDRDGPFATVAPARPLNGRTTFTVAKRPGRYVVVWVVAIPDGQAAEISEVRVHAAA